MNILFVHDDSDQSPSADAWRGMRYATAISRSNLFSAGLLSVDAFLHNSVDAQIQCNSADLIVIHGKLAGQCLAVIQRWKARDKVIVLDLSAADIVASEQDDKRQISSRGIGTPVSESLSWALRLVNAATASSRQVVEAASGYTQAYQIPEYLDLDRYLNLHPVDHEGVVVGVCLTGLDRQALENSGVITALERVCHARPHVKVVPWYRDARGMRREPVDLEAGLPGIDLDEWVWPRPLSMVDIGLAPLLNGVDRWRGWNDLLEYMVMKIPWVASEGPAYYDLRPYGWLVQNTPGLWERMLLDMVDHIKAYKTEAVSEPYLFGISQGIDENVENILSVYSAIYRQATHHEDGIYEAGYVGFRRE